MKSKNAVYRVSEFASKVGMSTETIRRMDNDGRFPARRSATGQRYYDDLDVRRFLNLPLEESRKTVVYCRVSSRNQASDLHRQREAMEQFCLAAGIGVDEWIEEIGGGMNMKRPKFSDLVFRISQGEVQTLVVAHKDRLTRFGFDLVEGLGDRMGTEIIVANQESLSPEKEMVEDLMAIIHSFSCRLYGLRKYSSSIRKDLES